MERKKGTEPTFEEQIEMSLRDSRGPYWRPLTDMLDELKRKKEERLASDKDIKAKFAITLAVVSELEHIVDSGNSLLDNTFNDVDPEAIAKTDIPEILEKIARELRKRSEKN